MLVHFVRESYGVVVQDQIIQSNVFRKVTDLEYSIEKFVFAYTLNLDHRPRLFFRFLSRFSIFAEIT